MIEVKNASKRIKGNIVLDDITMEVRSGTTVGLSGVNGSGKTMLLRAIAGLIGLTSGTVAIDGKVIGRDIAFPASVGILIENPAFLDTRTGFDNLRMLASIGRTANGDRENSKKRAVSLATTALGKVGLDPEDKRKFRKYSLGMKQRLGLAAAIIGDPDLILLDEPTNALDEDGVLLLRQLVCSQQHRGGTLIVTSHDASLLNELSDEVYYLQDGRVVDHSFHPKSTPTNRKKNSAFDEKSDLDITYEGR